jgi:hypothetical protein
VRGHLAELYAALDSLHTRGSEPDPGLRGLAPDLDLPALGAP